VFDVVTALSDPTHIGEPQNQSSDTASPDLGDIARLAAFGIGTRGWVDAHR
jgi:hypothetical protein